MHTCGTWGSVHLVQSASVCRNSPKISHTVFETFPDGAKSLPEPILIPDYWHPPLNNFTEYNPHDVCSPIRLTHSHSTEPSDEQHHAPLHFWRLGPPGSPDLGVSPMGGGPAEPGWASPCRRRCTGDEATSTPPWESPPQEQDQNLQEDDEDDDTQRGQDDGPSGPCTGRPASGPVASTREAIHPKILHGKTAGAPRGAACVSDPWTPARLLPSLARNPGPPPRQRHRRPRASSAPTARAPATPPVPANASLCVHSAADPTSMVLPPKTIVTCAWRNATDVVPDSARIVPSRRRSPSPTPTPTPVDEDDMDTAPTAPTTSVVARQTPTPATSDASCQSDIRPLANSSASSRGTTRKSKNANATG